MIRRFAHRLARLVLVAAAACAPTSSSERAEDSDVASRVIPGADLLLTENAHLIRGKRLALVSNHSGRLSDGRHLADVLHEWPEAELRVLFGMEYDIRSNDYSVARDPESTIDTATGLPKHSLYGAHHKPTPEMLGDVQVIVFDIQEVGARFYEHVNILGFVMEAAAERGIEVVVLDRPNPITGVTVDGFVTDDEFRYTFGAYTRIPVVHGMTMGELARLYAGERLLRGGEVPAVHVVSMRGWRRDMWYDETGLPWRKPSPNLLTEASLLAYIGTCLFEALNVSEGRGTDHPFEVIGAPWLDHTRAARMLDSLALPGVRFDTLTFIPEQKAYHGRPPEMTGEQVRGVRLTVTDRDAFQPYRTGIAMVWAVHRLHADRLVWNDAVLERLTATRRLRTLLKSDATPQDIYASWESELAAFRALRDRYVLYQ